MRHAIDPIEQVFEGTILECDAINEKLVKCRLPARWLDNGSFACGIHAGRPNTIYREIVKLRIVS